MITQIVCLECQKVKRRLEWRACGHRYIREGGWESRSLELGPDIETVHGMCPPHNAALEMERYGPSPRSGAVHS